MNQATIERLDLSRCTAYSDSINDVPMLSLCRTIEIDLLQMLGEKDVPPPIEPKNGVLM